MLLTEQRTCAIQNDIETSFQDFISLSQVLIDAVGIRIQGEIKSYKKVHSFHAGRPLL